MTTGKEAWDKKRENRLLIAVQNFVEKHNVTSGASIVDRSIAMIDAYQLIEDLCDIVGYAKSEDE